MMTLLEMIKKYEKVITELEKKRPEYPPDHLSAQIETMSCIVKDLKSIRDQQPSWVTVRDKIMKKMDVEIGCERYADVLTLAQTLNILPE